MRLLIILCLSIFCWTYAQAQPTKYDRAYFEAFPIYDDIAFTYFDEGLETAEDNYIQFEKRKTGWYAAHISYETRETKNSVQIWDAKTKAYTENYKFTAEKKAKQESLNGKLAQKIRQYNDFDYYVQPLAGYDGAAVDVVNLFKGMGPKKLTADEIQGLARAYDRATTWAYGATQFGDKIKEPNLKLAQKYSAKSLELFAYLAEKYPNHEGIVGEMPAKYSGICMHHWMSTNYFGKNDIDYLAKANFPEAMVAMAKNYLKACPKNAILITYGDNDTYPLWYVQEKLGFRQDVIILSESMLSYDKNLDYIHERYVKPGKLKLSFQKEDYYKKNDVYYRTAPDLAEKPISLASFLEQAKELADEPDEEKRVLHNQFYIEGKDTVVTVTLNSSYIHNGNLIFLDLIQENIKERPICWANVRYHSVFQALKEYEENLFAVQTLSLKNGNPNIQDYDINIADPDKLKEYFLNDFEQVSAAEFNAVKMASKPYLYGTLRAFTKLLEHYRYLEPKPEVVDQLVARLFEIYPPKEVAYGFYAVSIIATLYDPKSERDEEILILLDNYAISFKDDIEESKLENTTGYFTYYPLQSEKQLRKRYSEGLEYLKTLQDRALDNDAFRDLDDGALTKKLEELAEIINE